MIQPMILVQEGTLLCFIFIAMDGFLKQGTIPAISERTAKDTLFVILKLILGNVIK